MSGQVRREEKPLDMLLMSVGELEGGGNQEQ